MNVSEGKVWSNNAIKQSFIMDKQILKILISVSALLFSLCVIAKDAYLEPDEFLKQAFNNNVPKPDKLWVTKEIKEDVNNILGHDLGVVRLRYWDDKNKRAWILEEIGRDKPITVGLITANEKIEQLRVLIFRESRGWEVKYPFFTDQFKNVALNGDKELDKKIDGISGATLSVNALTKLARLALYLDAKVSDE